MSPHWHEYSWKWKKVEEVSAREVHSMVTSVNATGDFVVREDEEGGEKNLTTFIKLLEERKISLEIV